MKRILFLLLTVFALTACEDEAIKTQGELNGEKIMELVNKYSLTKAYFIEPREVSGSPIYTTYSFKVEGQYIYRIDDNYHSVIYSLDRVVKIDYNINSDVKKLILYFDKYEQGNLW